MADHPILPATLSVMPDAELISCQGNWTLTGIAQLNTDIESFILPKQKSLVIDGSAISDIDSSGAWKLYLLLHALEKHNHSYVLKGFTQQQLTLIDLIKQQAKKFIKPKQLPALSWVAQLGKRAILQLNELQKYLAFIGELTFVIANILRFPSRLRWRAIFSTIQTMGYQALPIIALLSFMIGVVLTYQMGLQLRNYGANVYIVDLLGLSVLREFAPLLTAIMIAGRTGSAFTAQLGTMKLNEEIDALNTMGIQPAELLIFPRLVGLFIALPLLTVWADIFGILGGMVMAKNMLGVTAADFLHRFAYVIPTKSLIIGISKAPVFAMIIASIGCFQGMQVSNSAESVGRQTTKSVVQAIFFIIVADAAFSIIFSTFKI